MNTAPALPHYLSWLVPLMLFLGGIGWAVCWWVVRRFIRTVDGLSFDLHDDKGAIAGIRRELHAVRLEASELMPREEHNAQQGVLLEKLEGLRVEGQHREDRIVAALVRHGETAARETASIRSEINAVQSRIDGVMAKGRT